MLDVAKRNGWTKVALSRREEIMLLTITASLLVGATAGLLFNVRIVLHLAVAAIFGFGLAALIGLDTPIGAALHAIAAVIALQCGYFVSLILSALGLTQEPVAVEEAHGQDVNQAEARVWKRPRA